MNYRIQYNTTSPTKTFDINELEEQFFQELYNKVPMKMNPLIHLFRMSDGTLSVYYGTYPIGKIKLQGRKHWMQILKGLYTSKSIEGNMNDFVSHIDDWIKYINKL